MKRLPVSQNNIDKLALICKSEGLGSITQTLHKVIEGYNLEIEISPHRAIRDDLKQVCPV